MLFRSFGETYWPTTRNAALYRPLTILAYQVQWAVGGADPLLFHTVNVILYAAVSAMVLRVAAEVMPFAAAWVAAALFAVHPVHVEAVGNVVGQAELWSSLTTLGALLAYLRGRRDGQRISRERGVIIAGLYFGGMLFKENAIVLPALLAAADVLASFESWRLLRDDQHLSIAEATTTLATSLCALLSPNEAHQ